MKVVGINGSPRANGNTSILIQTVFKELNVEGIETELIQLGSHPVNGCRACMVCTKQKNKKCIYQDDGFNEILDKLIEADGIILGSPVYSSDITSQLKAFIDRASIVLASNSGLLKHKVGATVVAARRGGAISAFDTMNRFLHSKEMFLVGSSYWNMGYGKDIGDVESDIEGMNNMKNIGENMAWILKKIY
jgi:multimeric flavodoxin WrbA